MCKLFLSESIKIYYLFCVFLHPKCCYNCTKVQWEIWIPDKHFSVWYSNGSVSTWSDYSYIAFVPTIWKPTKMPTILDEMFRFQTVGFQMVGLIVPTIWRPNIQNGCHLFGFQIVGLFSIQMTFENQTIWHPNNFLPFKIGTTLVFRSLLYFTYF